MTAAPPSPPRLPSPFGEWFSARGWAPHGFQLALLAEAGRAAGGAALLIAPTGGGKTLAGFLPSLVDLAADPAPGLHTLYVSPLKALAADIRRNLEIPIAEMALPIRVEDRTGDTSSAARARQRRDPPHILLTTPESLALLLSQEDAPRLFGRLRAVIVDEAHALAPSKRGDSLALSLARLETLSPGLRLAGLSATTEDPEGLARWLRPEGCRLIEAPPGPAPEIAILETAAEPPWAGAGGAYSAREVYAEILRARTALVFINTRALAELYLQALWAVNAEDIPIALHHGSLSREARQRVEAAMAAGELRAVVCTSSLDLGIDWGDVDLVIQIGAPKEVKRLIQRIGRSNHRFDAPSRALLVPANRFELIECRAALAAALAGEMDGEPRPPGRLDVLCQHLLLTACAGAFAPDALFAEIRRAGPYADLPRAEFDRCLEFCATGGYALRAYDRWRRLMETPEGLMRLRDPRTARQLRMNAGTIVEADKLDVRKGRLTSRAGGARLGEVEEAFAASLGPGDTFLIGGEVVAYEGLRETTVVVSPAPGREPKIPVFAGGKLAASSFLCAEVIAALNRPESWADLPAPAADWLRLQTLRSEMPREDDILVETFPRHGRAHLAAWTFAGRNANHTLGLLLTKRMEEAGLEPLGYLCNDYAILVWGLREVADPAPLFAPEGLRDGLETWFLSSTLMKRAFWQAAVVAGLIERRSPGKEKSRRQVSFSSEILYDTLVKYDPDHLMLEITRREAMGGIVDTARIDALLTRVEGRIRHIRADYVTPLAAPLLLEKGRHPVRGAAEERLIEEEAEALMADALG